MCGCNEPGLYADETAPAWFVLSFLAVVLAASFWAISEIESRIERHRLQNPEATSATSGREPARSGMSRGPAAETPRAVLSCDDQMESRRSSGRSCYR